MQIFTWREKKKKTKKQKIRKPNKKELQKKPAPHYAPIEGYLLVRADRINRRIYNFAEAIKNSNKKSISMAEFDKTIRAIQMLVSQELTYKGKEENKWGYLIKKK